MEDLWKGSYVLKKDECLFANRTYIIDFGYNSPVFKILEMAIPPIFLF